MHPTARRQANWNLPGPSSKVQQTGIDPRWKYDFSWMEVTDEQDRCVRGVASTVGTPKSLL